MLRFFRHIRQKLFLERRVSKYFGYALGEIALIVVGILLALQIGDWNRDRADADLGRLYIERLRHDFERDIALIEEAKSITQVRRGFTRLLNESVTDASYARKHPVEFLLALRHACRPSEPSLFTDTFDELRSTGNLRLINQATKEMLYDYYNSDQRMRQRQQIRNEVTYEFYRLSKPLLIAEHSKFLEDSGLFRVSQADMERARSMSYDLDSINGLIDLLIQNLELQGWFQRMDIVSGEVLLQHDGRLRKAREMLNALKQD